METASSTAEELRSFHAFLTRVLDGLAGQDPPSPEDCVALWRLEHQSPEELADTLEAIREGLADMHAGRTRPFEDFDRDFRERHGLPPRS
jgi:hypothetical protein